MAACLSTNLGRRQAGAALVEFSLILPLLLILAWAVTDLGRAIGHYRVLAQSAREAARYVSTQTPGNGTVQARNLVLYGRLTATGPYQLSGFGGTQQVLVSWQYQGSNPTLATVKVTIRGYRFDSMAASFWAVRFASITFGDISATMRAALCGSVC